MRPAGPVLVATRNVGKLRELRALFTDLALDVVDLSTVGIGELPIEAGLEEYATFEENAVAKARYFHRASRLPTVADDSGLAVDALGGAPGVHSKRYSGTVGTSEQIDAQNNVKLIRALAGVSDRRARFVCAAAYVDDRCEIVVRGETLGRIVDVPRGSHGFGYDPHFLADELGMTFGEADLARKQAISHRGKAFLALVTEVSNAMSPRVSVDAPAERG